MTISIIVKNNGATAGRTPQAAEVLRSCDDPDLCVSLGVVEPGQELEVSIWRDTAITVREATK